MLTLKLQKKLTEMGVEQRRLCLAEMVMERAAFYEERFKVYRADVPHNYGDVIRSLLKEYSMSRIALVRLSTTLAFPPLISRYS